MKTNMKRNPPTSKHPGSPLHSEPLRVMERRQLRITPNSKTEPNMKGENTNLARLFTNHRQEATEIEKLIGRLFGTASPAVRTVHARASRSNDDPRTTSQFESVQPFYDGNGRTGRINQRSSFFSRKAVSSICRSFTRCQDTISFGINPNTIGRPSDLSATRTRAWKKSTVVVLLYMLREADRRNRSRHSTPGGENPGINAVG